MAAVSLGSGDDGDPNDFTAAIARRLGVNQANQGYQYSSASPEVQNSAPAYQSTPSQGQPAYQQQDAPPSSAQLGTTAQQAQQQIARPASGSNIDVNTGRPYGAPRPGSTSLGPIGIYDPHDPTYGLGAFGGLIGGAGEIGPVGARIPGVVRGALEGLGGGVADAAGAIGRRLGLGAAGAADAERLNALRSAANVGQDAMRYSQPASGGLADAAARNAALDAVRPQFPSELPIQNVVSGNIGGIGRALRGTVTNPNVYLGGGTVAGIGGIGANLLALQQAANSGDTNAATGSVTPIIDANIAAQSPNSLAANAGRSGSLAGPAQGGGTVGSQPTIQQPTGSSGNAPTTSTPPTPFGPQTQQQASQALQAARGSVTPTIPGARGGVAPIIYPGGSQSGTGTVPTSGGLPQQGGPTSPSAQPSDLNQLTQQVSQSLTGISSELANTRNPDVLNVFLQQGQSILDMLKGQEDQLRSDAQTKGTTIDPATQFTLDTMQKQLDAQLSGVRENLNRRGLLQSGIELASENQVRSGSLSAQGQLLSGRLSKIQQDLENGLKSVNSQRFTAMKDLGLAGANAQARADDATLARRDDLLKALSNGSLTLRGQQSTYDTAAANRQNTASIAAANQQSQQGIANANLQAANARLNQSQQFTAGQNDLQRQAADARQAAALAAAAGNSDAQRQYSAQAAELQRQFTGGQNDLNRANQQPSANSTHLATNDFIAQLEGAPDKNTAMDAYNQALSDGTFQNAGADPLAILNAINQKQWGGGFSLPFGIGQ